MCPSVQHSQQRMVWRTRGGALVPRRVGDRKEPQGQLSVTDGIHLPLGLHQQDLRVVGDERPFRTRRMQT